MAYNEITKDQVINGVPVDQDVIATSIENQKFLKQVADVDEDLSALDRDIVPDSDNARDIGTSLLRMAELFGHTGDFNRVRLSAGAAGDLSLRFANSAITGLYSEAAGTINFRSAGYNSAKIDSSKLHVIAANNTQLHLESTQLGQEAVYSIGANNTGLLVRDILGAVDLLRVSAAAVELTSQLQAIDGTNLAPSLSFGSESGTGLYYVPGSSQLGTAIAGTEIMALTAASTEIKNVLMVSDGNIGNPSIEFLSSSSAGFSYNSTLNQIGVSVDGSERFYVSNQDIGFVVDNASNLVLDVASTDQLCGTLIFKKLRGTHDTPAPAELTDLLGDIIFNGAIDNTGTSSETAAKMCAYAAQNFTATENGSFMAIETTKVGSNISERKIEFGKPTVPQINMLGSFGGQKKVLTTAQTYVECDVEDFSVLKVDTSLGNIILDTMGGGVDTQLLFIFKSDPANTLTITHNSAALGQPLLTQNQTNLVLGAGYGGATFINDEGVWKEISIS